jgi:hypothetical protein
MSGRSVGRDVARRPRGGGFCNRWLFLSVRSTEVGTLLDFKVGGARAVGGAIFKTLKDAPCCVYRLVSLRIYRLGRARLGWGEVDGACCSTGPMSTSLSLIGRPSPERRRSALLIRATDPSPSFAVH